MPSATAVPAPSSRQATRRPVLVDGVLVAVGSLLLGALTSWAQGVLPDALASLANSCSGWTLCTVLLVAAVRPRVPVGAVWGAVGFVGLVLGYTAASQLRGLTYDPTAWAAIGLVAGPFVGAAAAALVTGADRWLTALGAALLAAILVAEAGYGLTVVDETTSPVYWTTCLVLGAALLLATGVRLRSTAPVVVMVAAWVVGTAALYGVLAHVLTRVLALVLA